MTLLVVGHYFVFTILSELPGSVLQEIFEKVEKIFKNRGFTGAGALNNIEGAKAYAKGSICDIMSCRPSRYR